MNIPPTSRREFLKTASVVTAAAAATAPLAVPPAAHAAGSDTMRIGLIGCGGRGTGAAAQALAADGNSVLTAMGDAFADRLDKSLASLRGDVPERVKVAQEQRFTGFNAYKGVIDSDADVVLLCSPPGFRPAHIEYAIKAGKHVFAEKPMAVDAPGVRSVMKSAAEAKRKNLALVAGFNARYSPSVQGLMRRVHDGAIGRVVAMHGSFNTGYLWNFPRKPEWSDMEWQVRNWYYFTWLSGDHLVEQAVHNVDKMAWAMRDRMPSRAVALGGRQVRVEPQWGHIYDHFSVVYEWDGDDNGGAGVTTRGFLNCRQQQNTANDISDHFMGTKGSADIVRRVASVSGENPWRYEGEPYSGHELEHVELFKSLRAGRPINDGERMANSTLMAIMGRMAAYTGQVITWEQAMNSQESLVPDKLEWGPAPTPPVAMPGRTKFL